jgi:hypothetical protein
MVFSPAHCPVSAFIWYRPRIDPIRIGAVPARLILSWPVQPLTGIVMVHDAYKGKVIPQATCKEIRDNMLTS